MLGTNPNDLVGGVKSENTGEKEFTENIDEHWMKTWKGPENHKKEPNCFIYLSVIILIILLLIILYFEGKNESWNLYKNGKY